MKRGQSDISKASSKKLNSNQSKNKSHSSSSHHFTEPRIRPYSSDNDQSGDEAHKKRRLSGSRERKEEQGGGLSRGRSSSSYPSGDDGQSTRNNHVSPPSGIPKKKLTPRERRQRLLNNLPTTTLEEFSNNGGTGTQTSKSFGKTSVDDLAKFSFKKKGQSGASQTTNVEQERTSENFMDALNSYLSKISDGASSSSSTSTSPQKISDDGLFPRCEYYTRFSNTTLFEMNEPEFNKTYVRSTSSRIGGEAKQLDIQLPYKSKLVKIGSDSRTKLGLRRHSFSHQSVTSSYTHRAVRRHIPKKTSLKPRNSSAEVYEKSLNYRQKICHTINFLAVTSGINQIYYNEYPCLMVKVPDYLITGGKDVEKARESWAEMYMCCYVAIIDYLAFKKGIPIETVLRSSFGHNLPSVSETAESFRINVGLIPMEYADLIVEALTYLPKVFKKLKESEISFEYEVNQHNFNSYVTSSDVETEPMHYWYGALSYNRSMNIIELLNMRASKGKKNWRLIQEMFRFRSYKDFFTNLILDGLMKRRVVKEQMKGHITKALVFAIDQMLKKASYGDSFSFNKGEIENSLRVNGKCDTSRFIKALERNKVNKSLWKILVLLLPVKFDKIPYKDLYVILEYSRIELMNRIMANKRLYNRSKNDDNNYGSDSDCEFSLDGTSTIYDLPDPGEEPEESVVDTTNQKIYGKKIIINCGMMSITLALLASQKILCNLGEDCSIYCDQAYYEVAKGLFENLAPKPSKKEKESQKERQQVKILYNKAKEIGEANVALFDLNHCVVDGIPTDIAEGGGQEQFFDADVLREEAIKPITILDYTSASLDKIRNNLRQCLRNRECNILLLVNSALKNSQGGNDIVPWGTIRIFTKDKGTREDFHQLIQEVINSTGWNAYAKLPELGHIFRRGFKDAGFVLTNSKIIEAFNTNASNSESAMISISREDRDTNE